MHRARDRNQAGRDLEVIRRNVGEFGPDLFSVMHDRALDAGQTLAVNADAAQPLVRRRGDDAPVGVVLPELAKGEFKQRKVTCSPGT